MYVAIEVCTAATAAVQQQYTLSNGDVGFRQVLDEIFSSPTLVGVTGVTLLLLLLLWRCRASDNLSRGCGTV